MGLAMEVIDRGRLLCCFGANAPRAHFVNAFINVCETTSKASSDSLRLFDHLAESGSEIFGEAVAGLFANNVAFFIFDVDLFGFESVLAAVGFIS